MAEGKRYRVELIVESASPTTGRIKHDIVGALAPLGFFPHVVSVVDVLPLTDWEKELLTDHDIPMDEEARLRGQH